MIWALLPFGIFLFWYALYILWNGHWWGKLEEIHPSENPSKTKVSVIIPARNEEKNLEACLRSVLNQDYPTALLEVILVNDHSEDQTLEIAQKLAIEFPRLRVVSLEKDGLNSHKKAALAQGISLSSGEIILTTDADCLVTPTWVKTMVAAFSARTGLVSGPVQLVPGLTWLEKFQALEFMGLVAVGAASMQAGAPNLANGANLAFRRATFDLVDGYAGIDDIASGDDELLLQKILLQTDWQAKFAFAKAAIVRTPAQPDWASLKAQRIRWVSKSRHYKNKFMTLQLTVSWLAMWFFPLALIFSIWDWRMLMVLFAGFLLKSLADGFILWRASRFFQNQFLLKYLIPEEILHIPYLIWAGIAGNMGKYEWKGRRVK
ncbi:MAG: glycosyltransferase [Bacteroidia bacterium]|nr:glycosyltransferase [Bacteroidia bacterium]